MLTEHQAYHDIIFHGKFAAANDEGSILSYQERIDLNWCDYGDYLAGWKSFDGPGSEAFWKMIYPSLKQENRQ
jgi:hypothetical protein